jgi:tetratricopeptide (TPR) repeat protein
LNKLNFIFIKMRIFFILYTFLIFIIPAFGQTDIDGFLYFSKRFADSKKYEEAIAEINKAIDIKPSNAGLYLQRAHLYGQLQNSAAALENVLIAVSLKPDDLDFLEHCATELNLSGNYEESLKIAERLISSKERDKMLLGYRISYRTRFLKQDFTGAIEDIITSRDIDGAYWEGRELYIDADKKESFTDGLLVETLNHLKDDSKIFAYYEALFAIIEQMEKKDFGSIHGRLMLYSMDCDLYARYALIYEEKHTPAETSALLENYAKEFSLEKRAEVFQRMKKYELAVKDLTEVLKTTSIKPYYLIMRGDIYILLKQFDRALADYETAVKIDKEYSETAKRKISEAQRMKNEITQTK